ncbi:MAG: hypothetical protein AUH15_03375 [Acidobacteriales bacterium 13_2_20CM_55_8]|nr:MAG: hypothetical protein AUH15_03375 [Acidobacteriales bacterium 13_2_20CM_55_8]
MTCGTMRGQILKAGMLLLMTLLLAESYLWAAQRYSAKGLVLKVDRSMRALVVSCQDIPGYMDAMVMPFTVREAKALDGLAPGMVVEFTLVVNQKSSYVEDVRVRSFDSTEREPVDARRLKLLEGLIDPKSVPSTALAAGQPVPNFALTDQNQRRISLHQLTGKVVAMNFVYTRCALPEYCYRLSNNFGRLQKRFKERMGRDLVLLTVTFDPVHDHPEILANYAKTWKADPESWHFLTGSVPDVERVCNLFGVSFWPDEAQLTHSLHTAVIDRQGKLVANLEGNQFTAEQLGDLVETVIRRPH